ncbi:putative glutamine amidotransferase [Amycolatopsis marina]|uniref:Putative glutamine amidotransferase n=1 Tax=Amycolatopsis marina TaxID=490629 RepID=A0A1I0WJ58_9PSEU|nr:gamma-glutamyl-gamma-aminobutyrate hydrolase family protein [Amycolatopsis marina]SFA88789.1 putative glutamine amidotransferase [Amycolatopsis marina]
MVSSGSDRPVIGLTTYAERTRFGVWDVDAAVLHRSYVDSVVRAGGVPVLLPPAGDAHGELLPLLDGLVLTGGADIEPRRYGSEAHATTVTRPDRDAAEFALAEAALSGTIPVLGVCRGMEVLNVVLGGTLVQHLPEVTGTVAHQPEVAVFGDTVVTLAAASRAAAVLGTETACRCYHHQAVATLGDGLQAVGWAADGTIEALELPGERFVLGVQWHPEQDSADLRLFGALVEAATKKSGGES